MAKDGLALIFGPGKKGMKGEEPDDEEMDEKDDEESEGDDKEEVRGVARKMLDAVKADDEDALVDALEEWKGLDEKWDRDEDKDY